MKYIKGKRVIREKKKKKERKVIEIIGNMRKIDQKNYDNRKYQKKVIR